MRRFHYLLFVIVVVVLVSAAVPDPASGQASPEARKGLIFDGLQLRPGGPCGNGFEIGSALAGHRVRCTHGPDPAPEGVDVRRRWVASDSISGTRSLAAAQAGIPCFGTGSDGFRVQLLYARRSGTANQLTSLRPSFVTWAANASMVFNASAAKTGGTRHLRYVTDAGCNLVITAVEVSAAALGDMATFVNELVAQGHTASNRRFLAWTDANVYCGIGEVYDDDSPSPTPGLTSSNLNNGHPAVPGSFARVDNGCWGLADSVEVHELVHTMGGVQPSAPNATQGFHCTDDRDRLCYLDGSLPGTLFQTCIGPADENRLDCNSDDYFSTSTLPGSYLASHWNVASSAFLSTTDLPPTVVASDGGPKQFFAMVGTGSDTTQDVMNALAGFVNNNNFTPVQSSLASGLRQLTSWDAIGATCITPKAGGTTFLRPNGSTNGRKALSRSIDGAAWPASTTSCGGPKVVSGLVDFARSSAGPPVLGTALTYLPFGRDALSFAFYRSAGAPVTTLTSAQLNSLFTSGPATIDGVEIIPCGIQTGSGTYQSWNTAVGVDQATEQAATVICRNAGSGVAIQENDAAGLKAKGDSAALAGKQVIIGFSAANFISQTNGFAATQLAVGVDLGAIDALGKPYTGMVAPIAPSSTFYANTVYGRDVYNVVPTSRFAPPAGSNADFKSMFVGPTSSVCTATTVISNFGFAPIGSACGSTTLQGALIAN